MQYHCHYYYHLFIYSLDDILHLIRPFHIFIRISVYLNTSIGQLFEIDSKYDLIIVIKLFQYVLTVFMWQVKNRYEAEQKLDFEILKLWFDIQVLINFIENGDIIKLFERVTLPGKGYWKMILNWAPWY